MGYRCVWYPSGTVVYLQDTCRWGTGVCVVPVWYCRVSACVVPLWYCKVPVEIVPACVLLVLYCRVPACMCVCACGICMLLQDTCMWYLYGTVGYLCDTIRSVRYL
jgi:hypothetical protein